MSLTPGSSMDRKVLAEAEELIYGKEPTISAERAEELEAMEYGVLASNQDEQNDQKVQEMQLVVASKGWGYICDFWQQLIDVAEREMKNPNISDEETINKKRDWLALQNAIGKAKRAVSVAANTPLSTDLPR
jgi:hypothetical protein